MTTGTQGLCAIATAAAIGCAPVLGLAASGAPPPQRAAVRVHARELPALLRLRILGVGREKSDRPWMLTADIQDYAGETFPDVSDLANDLGVIIRGTARRTTIGLPHSMPQFEVTSAGYVIRAEAVSSRGRWDMLLNIRRAKPASARGAARTLSSTVRVRILGVGQERSSNPRIVIGHVQGYPGEPAPDVTELPNNLGVTISGATRQVTVGLPHSMPTFEVTSAGYVIRAEASSCGGRCDLLLNIRPAKPAVAGGQAGR
ncbi:MAG: hypothetical protein KGJ62_13155 [Armatimonadetes bacterium]|nr:hypothetical protein [Armatimonadota bacterium]MDE2206127.1 hypothetical protein [Armatimonadota bacterium]